MPWYFYDSNGNYLSQARGTQAVIDGGTGVSSLTDGGVLLGSGTGAITAMSVPVSYTHLTLPTILLV